MRSALTGGASCAARLARRSLMPCVAGAALGLAALMLVPPLLGYERYVITGGSMSGTIERGSIVFAEVVDPAELEVGDVITYEPPPRSGLEGQITHRIISIAPGDGAPVLRTQGDANPDPDPWRFSLAGTGQARYEFSVPYAGYAFAALGIRAVRIGLIGIPALLIAFALSARLGREAGEAAAARRAARRSGPAPAPIGRAD